MLPGKDKARLVEAPAKPFECRVCGHDRYISLTESVGISAQGGYVRIVGYECRGCGVVFNDVEEFSNK